MGLSHEERAEFVRLAHKMTGEESDHEWGAGVVLKTADAATQTATLATLLTDVVTEAVQIAALDELPQGAKDDAVVRWS